ncbi:uncharacterized protein BXZ73DRAFT_44292 [Epithele typhae]|uniref:uncharacterized protein n=1 Tax=Epithele typhae TaxID=378194 RepID=UPI0020088455|nr:uncharacterized protein BXZ73DRAFT_44292 [Epithele typhae]KAH9938977.1 hypothetical protein BXZ73DRAFT_44292 [Epithele typhae]
MASITHTFVPPPPGLNYIVALGPSVTLLMVGTVCASMLIPITVGLFLVSSPSFRRSPLFILNVLSLCFGLILGVLNIIEQVRAILAMPVNNAFNVGAAIALFLCPFFAEGVLILRVVAVYPPAQLSWPKRVAIYGTIAAFKIARIGNFVQATVQLWDFMQNNPDPAAAALVAQVQPWPKVEWFLQTFDTSFASMLFLARLRVVSFRRPGQGGLNVSTGTSASSSRGSYLSRLRLLFWIAASNFVIPVLLNVGQLVDLYLDPNFLNYSYIYFVNVYVAIVGTLLATIWCSSTGEGEGTGGARTARTTASGARAHGDAHAEHAALRDRERDVADRVGEQRGRRDGARQLGPGSEKDKGLGDMVFEIVAVDRLADVEKGIKA